MIIMHQKIIAQTARKWRKGHSRTRVPQEGRIASACLTCDGVLHGRADNIHPYSKTN